MASFQKLFLPAAAGFLALLHMSGIEILPGPCVITLCVMQAFTVLNAFHERPQKGAAKTGLEAVAVLVQSICSFGAQVMAEDTASAWRSVGFMFVCILARSLRAAGVFGSPAQVVGIACLCGGVACLGYIAATRIAQQQDHAVCDCRRRHEVACCAGEACPYHPKFWPDMPSPSEQDAVEVIDKMEEELFVANLMGSHHCGEGDFSKSIPSEATSIDHLADEECHTLVAELSYVKLNF